MSTDPEIIPIIRYKCENDFLFFCRYMFKRVYGHKFVLNWHHQEMSDLLTKIYNYEVKNAIINIPPRYTKTEMAKMFVAWSLAKDARAKFILLSYSSELVLDNSASIKDYVENDYFQELWPIKLKRDSKSKKLWKTESGGGVYATSTAGQITGFGAGRIGDGDEEEAATDDSWMEVDAYTPDTPEEASFIVDAETGTFGGAIIIDDPHKVDDIESALERQKVNDRMNETITSRRNSRSTPIIVIMQRLHTQDMSAFLLGGGIGEEFEHLSLPAIYTKDGEERALWPFKHTLDDLKTMQKADARTFAGQYLQTPVPKGGASFKLSWLRYYNPSDMPWGRFIPYIFVDTAKTKGKHSDYTAMMVVCTGGDQNYYVADIVRDKLNLTERVKTLMDLHRKWLERCGRPPIVAYEKTGSESDIDHLELMQRQEAYRMNIIVVGKRSGSKEDNIETLVPLFETGRLYLPEFLVYIDSDGERRNLVDEFVNEEYVNFPVAKHDDMLDALSRMTERNKEGKRVIPMIFPKQETAKGKYQPRYETKKKQPKNFLNR